VLLAKLLLGVSQVRLGLLGYEGASHADLTLDRRDCLARHLAHGRAGGHQQVLPGRAAELLDARGDAPLVIARLLEVLLQALLVALLLGHGDVGGEIRLELGLLAVGLAQPLHQSAVAFVHVVSFGHLNGSFRRRSGQAGLLPLASLS
jgi:hypothetical protein